MQFQMLCEFAWIKNWSSYARNFSDKEIKQFVKMLIVRFGLRRADATPYRSGHGHLADTPPIEQSGPERAVRLSPEPGIIYVRIHVAERDQCTNPLRGRVVWGDVE